MYFKEKICSDEIRKSLPLWIYSDNFVILGYTILIAVRIGWIVSAFYAVYTLVTTNNFSSVLLCYILYIVFDKTYVFVNAHLRKYNLISL